MTHTGRSIYLLPLLLLLAIWSGWFIFQSSFDIYGTRYFSLFDDAMISMTYAKNVTQGHGLNWAKFGDPVEGFSSPLWTFCMVPFQFLPCDWGKVSLFFAIFCALIVGLNVVLLDRILNRRLGVTSVWPRVAATFALAFLYPLNYWSLVGMECGPQVLIFLLGMDQLIAFEQGRSTRHLYKLGAVLAAAMLLRMDMVFFVFWTIVFLAPWLWQNKAVALRFLLIAGLPMAGYLIFRMLYFHDIFPNTYYLKLYKIPLAVRIARAWPLLVGWAKPLWLIWVLVIANMVVLRRNRYMWLAFILILTYLAYDVYVGGDAWELSNVGANRFTIITIPWVILILTKGSMAWAEHLRGIAVKIVPMTLSIGSLLLLWLLANGLLFVPNTDKQWNRFLVIEQPYNTVYQLWNTVKALEMNEFLGTANRAATVQAGDIGYFADCELVDQMGYNDREIARMEPYWDLSNPKDYLPGHCKVNYRRTIGELKPDYIVDKWVAFNPQVAQEYDTLVAQGGYEEWPNGGLIRAGYVKRNRP